MLGLALFSGEHTHLEIHRLTIVPILHAPYQPYATEELDNGRQSMCFSCLPAQ